jgi:hypothetical protein
MQQQISREMQTCIDNCLECASVCEQTLSYCLSQGGKHVEGKHLKILMDCVDICYTSARVMARGSDLHVITCRACAEICRACADECNTMDDETMKRCAIVCEKCASSCESMSGGTLGLGANQTGRQDRVGL